MILEIKSILKSYNPREGNVIDSIDLRIKKGAIVSLLGESGSGKTTLARLIAGLEVPDGGEMILDGNVVANHSILVPPQRREVGMVFQDYALFPHMTVLENVGYGIAQSTEKKDRIEQVLNLVGLQDFGYRFPHQLSGGQQQRVFLARALAQDADLYLLDEPFAGVDAATERAIIEVLKDLKAEGKAGVAVHHEIGRAAGGGRG